MTGITLLPGETLQAAQAEVQILMSRLTPVEAIREAIAEIDARITLSDAMAVHVRRGTDIVPPLLAGGLTADHENRLVRGFVRAYVDLESYRRAVKALGSPPCFIFCHDDAVRTQIKADLGGHTVDDCPAFSRLSPLQRDFAEIMVMSKTRRLLGVKSNYSGLARLLGDLKVAPVYRWLAAEDMIEMIVKTFSGRRELQVRILRDSAVWYARSAPAASVTFAALADEIEAQALLQTSTVT